MPAELTGIRIGSKEKQNKKNARLILSWAQAAYGQGRAQIVRCVK